MEMQKFQECRDQLSAICEVVDSNDLSSIARATRVLIAAIDDQELVSNSQAQAVIVEGTAEIVRMVESDLSSSEALDEIERSLEDFGVRVGPPSQADSELEAWSDWGADGREEDDVDEHDIAAPSSEDVGRLLGLVSAGSQPEEVVAHLPSVDAPESVVEELSTPSAKNQGIQDLDPELQEAFLADASSCVCEMESAALALEKNPQDRNSSEQILRELHTLKGASGSVGLEQLAEQIHHFEDELRQQHESSGGFDVSNILAQIDRIRTQVFGKPTTQSTECDLSFEEVASSSDETVRVRTSQLNRLMNMLAELVMFRNQRETELTELTDVYRELNRSVTQMRLLSDEGNVESAATKSLKLSEVANDVREAAQNLRDCVRPVAEGNEAISSFLRQFRQEVLQLRRSPIGGLCQRLERAVRDAAKAEGKQVELRQIGSDAGIERSLQQRLYEPLLHIVRNSVCHGIEPPQTRREKGKTPAGTITLEGRSGADLFTIEICDDGNGLDYQRIRHRGIERGLIDGSQSVSDQELAQLIFHPGFSTRESADQIAGRGVGMDVVADTLRRMRGWLEIDSKAGEGTRIRLSFPLPSVIQHAMVFRSGEQLFAIPMQAVLSAGNQQSESTSYRFTDLISQPKSDASERISLSKDFVSDQHNCPVTLLVDEIVGPEELVVRSMPGLLKNHPFCNGATVSGHAEMVLLLDPRQLLLATADGKPTNSLANVQPPHSPQVRALVVDDSLSARQRVVRSLSRYPVTVVEAPDGRAALEMLSREKFDVVFSDMEMPNVTGMELLAEIKSDASQQSIPVVMISSRTEAEFTEQAADLGAVAYLGKPLLDSAMDEALGHVPAFQNFLSLSGTSIEGSV